MTTTKTAAASFTLDFDSEATLRLLHSGYANAAIILRNGQRVGTVYMEPDTLEYVAYIDGDHTPFRHGQRFDAAAMLVESLPEPAVPAWTTIPVQAMKPGYRYWSVRPGYESNWTVRSVDIREAEYQVDRGQGCFSPVLVTVTRRDGVSQTLEYGEEIAIQGPWKTV